MAAVSQTSEETLPSTGFVILKGGSAPRAERGGQGERIIAALLRSVLKLLIDLGEGKDGLGFLTGGFFFLGSGSVQPFTGEKCCRHSEVNNWFFLFGKEPCCMRSSFITRLKITYL